MRFVLNLLLVLVLNITICGSINAQNARKSAEKYYKAKDYQKAYDQYNLIKNIEKDKVALAKRGICSYHINKLINASKDLTTAYKIGNTNSELKYYMGRINHSMRKYEDAIFFYKSYLRELKPSEEIRPDVAMAIKNCFAGMRYDYDDEDVGFIENAGNIVNSADDEINPVPSPTFVNRYYFSSNRAQDNYDLFSAEQLEGKWQQGHHIHSSLNTAYNELLQDCSLDGSVMVFLRGDDMGSNRLYINRYSESKHNQRVVFSETKAVSGDKDVYLVNDEIMIFASDREGGYGGYDLYISSFSANGWSVPINLGAKVNTSYDERYPFLSENQEQLFFSSNNPNSIGGFDIFSAVKQGDEWGEINYYNFPLNSPEDDIQFRIQEEGFQAYLASNRKTNTFGGFDIFTVYLRKGYDVHTSEPKQPLGLIKSSVKDEEYAYNDEAEKEALRLANEQIAEEQRLEEERVAKEKLAEEQRLEEERVANEKLAEEQRLEEERVANEKLAEEQRLEEERLANEKLAEEQRLEEERLAKEKLAEEQRLEEERLANEKMAEAQRLEDERLAKEKLAEEQRLEEERLANEKMAEEQRLEEERLTKEKMAEEQRLEEERLTKEKMAEEQRLEEERLANEKMAEEQRLEEERVANEKLVEEQRLEEERLANEKILEAQRLEEEKLVDEKLMEEISAENTSPSALEGELANISLQPILYKKDSDLLNANNLALLDETIVKLKRFDHVKIILTCHSIAEGLPEFELMFAIKRAEKIAAYLIENGIEEDRVILKGVGSAYPFVKKIVDPELNKEVKLYNNRIDISLIDVSDRSMIQNPEVDPKYLSSKYELYQTITEDIYFRIFIHETEKKMYKNAILRYYNDLLIEHDLSKATYKYYVGLYTDFKSTFELKRELENRNITEATIVAFYKGIVISPSDAKLLKADFPELINFIEISQ